MVTEHLFEDRTSLFTALATDCQSHLQQALQNNDAASLMVSGGSTPAPLYESLSESDLDWQKIAVALVDERWVDEEHSASNTALIKRTLLINNAANSHFTEMKNEATTAEQGCAKTEVHYRKLPQPFTVTILGMGGDGHTASLFPHSQGLEQALDEHSAQLTAAIMAQQSEVTGANVERISLTLNGLLKSERLILLLTGQDKLDVFKTAMGAGAVADMPVRAVLRQNQVPVDLYWAP